MNNLIKFEVCYILQLKNLINMNNLIKFEVCYILQLKTPKNTNLNKMSTTNRATYPKNIQFYINYHLDDLVFWHLDNSVELRTIPFLVVSSKGLHNRIF